MLASAENIREIISASVPEGLVVPAHTDHEHFYDVVQNGVRQAHYPSVTGKLQILKDEGLINYKMNRALEYVFANFSRLTENNLMAELALAAEVSGGILRDAGDIGTRIHNARERYFSEWIKLGSNPGSALNFRDPKDPLVPWVEDIRENSALRALDKFVKETDYEPVVTEMLLYNKELKVGGTLDDLGIMWWPKEIGNPHCPHTHRMDYEREHKGLTDTWRVCLQCGYKAVRAFVLMDIKTSNQFKDHYFFQVAIYYWMFYKLTNIRPQYCFILKLSKEDGCYKIEDLKRPAMLASFARSMIRTHDGIEFIKKLRKNNQKVVGEKMEL